MYFPPGKAPSLDIAKTILVVTVIWENPPRYTLITSKIVIARAPATIGFPSVSENAS